MVDGGASREFIWVTDSEGGLYLAADMGTAIAQLSGVRSLLPVSYSIGAFPDFTDAIATKDTALVNPARLYAISYNTGRKGYVKIDTVYQNYLSIANVRPPCAPKLGVLTFAGYQSIDHFLRAKP